MSDPATDGTAEVRGGRARPPVVVPGVLSLLVTAALLVPLPVAAGLVVVAVLVLALAVLAVGARGGWRATSAGQVLWFWGVVTGLGHLLRSLVAEHGGVESAVIGAVVTAVWALSLGLLRRSRRR